MKRYAVCKIYGDGDDVPVEQWSPTKGPFRAAINDIVDGGLRAYAFSTELPPADPQTGAPMGDWCLVIASGKDFALVANHSDIDLMPDFPLSGKLNAISVAQRSAALNRLSARGISVADLSLADGYGEMIRLLGQKLRPNFHELDFDIAE